MAKGCPDEAVLCRPASGKQGAFEHVTEGKCPACGAPVVFSAGAAAVRVCEHCQTVVARKDATLEAHGKVARIVDTDSPLALNLDGKYRGVGFRLVGHLQRDHGAGPWDEWFVQLDDGRSAWLSESEGALNWMFPAGTGGQALAAMGPGVRVQVAGKPFVVEEVGSARVVSAAGELPTDVDPAASATYADATGEGGVFATLDFGDGIDTPELYVGHVVTLAELGISPDALRPRVRAVSLAQARCSQCNGPLALAAPDRSRRVACPYCAALHEVSGGTLAFLQLLDKPALEPAIALGSKGRLSGTEWVCIAFLGRSCRVDGLTYDWREYLLFHRVRGFAWLMESDGHWTFLTPLPAGDVTVAGAGVQCRGALYRSFQSVTAQTDFVLGECYWEVSVGETATAKEYVAPPRSVNEERTGNEVTYTLGEYLAPEKVREAFPKARVGLPQGVAPAQPNPARAKLSAALPWAGVYMVAALVLYIVANVLAAKEHVLNRAFRFPTSVPSGSQEAMQLAEGIDIHQRGNLQLRVATAGLNNEWLGLQGDLFNEETGEVRTFYTELSEYHGVDGDGAWAEGRSRDEEFLSALSKGRYTLRLTPFFEGAQRPGQVYQVDVELVSDLPRGLWLWLAWLALAVWPLILFLRSSAFEKRRWENSNLVVRQG